MENKATICPNSYAEHYLEPLKKWLEDDDVTEIVVNPDGKIFIEFVTSHNMEPIPVSLSENAIKQIGSQIAAETRNALGRLHPIVSGRIQAWDRPIRAQIIVEPAIESGVSLSLRKYDMRSTKDLKIKMLNLSDDVKTDEKTGKLQKVWQLRKRGKLDEMLQYMVDAHLNLLISGGTSSGKTTLAKALLNRSDQKERIITIEDAQELNPPHQNNVPLIADRREGSEHLPSRLLESSLRMRPDRLILGEIRGVEAYEFLESINTGHPGAISTIHADTPVLAFDRLALMVMRTGIKLSYEEIVAYARRTIDVVIQIGRHKGKRGIKQIYLPLLD